MFGSRILVLAPHPDDELAGCCAALQRARARGSSVSIAFLTTGVPDAHRFWPWQRAGHSARVARRREEARRVCGELGAEVAHVSDIPARQLRNELRATRELIHKLCGAATDILWTPAYEGGHPDHDVTNFIASSLCGEVAVWEFSEYNFAGGRVHSNEFPFTAGTETEISLTPSERNRKRDLLRMYLSERSNLSYLRLEREVFRPLHAYDYSRPPHSGTLFYRRFAWAAFHPRVNEVRPEEVLRAIAEFRAGA